MPLNQVVVSSLVERLRRNDPSLTALDLSPRKIYELNNEPVPNGFDIGPNYIGDRQWQQLVEAMRHNTVLKRLELLGSGINTLGAQQLAAILSDNRELTFIDIRSNSIGHQGITAIANALILNQTVREIYLSSNNKFDNQTHTQIIESMSQRAQSMADLINNTNRVRTIDFPEFHLANRNALRNLIASMERNTFTQYYNAANNFRSSFQRAPDLRDRALKVCHRNDTIRISLYILSGRNFNQVDIQDNFPEIPELFPRSTNFMPEILNVLIRRMQNNVPNINRNMYLIDAVHNVYRLLYAEKYATEGNVIKCGLTLKKPFVNQKLQAIADQILLPILNHRSIASAFINDEEKSSLYWFQAYVGWKLGDDAIIELAAKALKAIGIIPANADYDIFINQLAILENRISDYRNVILNKIQELELQPQTNLFSSLFSRFSWTSSQSASSSASSPSKK